MPTTKLIYGVGRVPKASEFSLGEIIVNVDDSKVYSKNKSNVVFEIGGGGTTIIGGEGDGLGFATASISASGFFTSADTSNLIISGGTGVSVTTGSNNQIIITATGDAEITHVISADTASYIESSNIDGILFSFNTEGEQGDILFDNIDIEQGEGVSANALGLSTTDNVTFAQVSSSGLLFASASEETTGGDNIRVIVYDTASGQFYFTGSYGGGGGDYWYNGGTFLSSSVPIRVEGSVSSSRLTLDSDVELRNQNGNLFITNKTGGGITGSSVNFIESDVSDFNLLEDSSLTTLDIGGNTSTISIGQNSTAGAINLGPTNDANHTTDIGGQLLVRKNATFNNPVTASSHISASGLLYASASEETSGGDNIRAVVYDTASGQFYFTGSYSAGGDDNDWYIDTGNSRLTSSLDVYVKGNITGSNLYIDNSIEIGDTAGSPKIQFNKSVNATIATTAEVSILADNSGYKQSLNFFNVVGSGRYSSLTIGTNEYFKANFNNGARVDKYFIINGDDDGVDFIVSGSNFPDLLVAAVDSDNVGVGYGSSSLSATYGDYKLAVSGNLYSDGYLTLASKDNTTGVAGALLYSSSNEFYLGFS